MEETLFVTTAIGIPVASTAGATTITDTATNYKTDDDGNVTESKIVPKGAITSLGVSTATTGSYVYQEYSENKTFEQMYAQVDATQAYVDSLSDEELEQALYQVQLLEEQDSSINKPKKL